MKKILGVGGLALLTCSFAHAISYTVLPLGVNAIGEQSMKEAISNITTLTPIENVDILIYSNTIGGSKQVLETNSCIKAVEFFNHKMFDKPVMIMDGGYTVQLRQNDRQFVLKSSDDRLFSWINRCSEKFSVKQ